MKKRHSRTKHAGFSIIELLVAIAVISIVASIAQPAYQNYTARARQSEAKAHLAAIYAAEKSFQAENGFYSACLANLGFTPEGAHQYYTVGFTQGFVNASQPPYYDFFQFQNCLTWPGGKVDNNTWFQAKA